MATRKSRTQVIKAGTVQHKSKFGDSKSVDQQLKKHSHTCPMKSKKAGINYQEWNGTTVQVETAVFRQNGIQPSQLILFGN